MLKKCFGSVISICLLILSSCHEKPKGAFNVNGNFANADKLASLEGGPISKVYLLEITYGKEEQPLLLDSAKISGKNGSFSLSTSDRSQNVYELVFGNDVLAVPLINDTKEITVDVDLGKKDDFYEVKGSPATNQLKDLVNVFGKKNFEVGRMLADLDSLKKSGAPDTVLLAQTIKENSAVQDMNTYLKQFMNTNNNPTVCALALTWASRSLSPAEFASAMNDLLKKYPDNNVLQGMKQSYDQQVADADRRQKASAWVGKQAPDLSLPDANGNMLSLASFRGKYLLVDVWASWCEPCRQENPNVVKAYHTFKGKNFAILGVSLDSDKDAWEQAVLADSLGWTQVSDLQRWESKAVTTFHFNGIPYNVLIDPQGKIIAEGLQGQNLVDKLAEVLK
jgi:peroxiredoxin